MLGPLLVIILQRLDVKDVVFCSEACVSWNVICQDQLLWRHLFTRHFKFGKGTTVGKDVIPKLRHGAKSWKEEHIRLTYQVPCVTTQTLKGYYPFKVHDKVVHIPYIFPAIEYSHNIKSEKCLEEQNQRR